MRQKEWEKNSIKNPGIAVMVDKYEAGVQPNLSGVGVGVGVSGVSAVGMVLGLYLIKGICDNKEDS